MLISASIILASPPGLGTVVPRCGVKARRPNRRAQGTAIWSPAGAAGCRGLSFWAKNLLGVGPKSRRSSPTVEGRLGGLVGGHSPSVTRVCGQLSWDATLTQDSSWRRPPVAAVAASVVPRSGGKARWPGELPQPFVHPLVRLAVVCCGLGQKSSWRRSQVVEVILHYCGG